MTASRAQCLADRGCRAYFGRVSAATFNDLVTKRLQLVRDWNTALTAAASSSFADDDIRHYFWEADAIRAQPVLVTWDASTAARNCTALSADPAQASGAEGAELRDLAHLLLEYAVFLADERLCDESSVLSFDPETGVHACSVAADHVCVSSTGFDSRLTLAAYILGFIVLVAVVVAIYLPTGFLLRHAFRQRDSAELETLVKT